MENTNTLAAILEPILEAILCVKHGNIMIWALQLDTMIQVHFKVNYQGYNLFKMLFCHISNEKLIFKGHIQVNSFKKIQDGHQNITKITIKQKVNTSMLFSTSKLV